MSIRTRRLWCWLIGLCGWGLTLGALICPAQGVELSSIAEAAANPHVTSPEQLARQVARYTQLWSMLQPTIGSPDVDQAAARAIQRFLAFAQPMPGWEQTFIDQRLVIQFPSELDQTIRPHLLEHVQAAYDLVSQRWHAHLKLELPTGFVFLKLYEQREHMAQEYQLGPETVGVAFPCRYIAVAIPVQPPVLGQSQKYVIGAEFQQTVAHELVHSFCFMRLGWRDATALPRWFMEGLALYMSGEQHVRTVIEGPGGTLIRDFDSSDEYKGFRQLFRFIHERYGPPRTYAFARAALEQKSADHALASVLNLTDQTALVSAAVIWRQDKERFQRRLILLVSVLALTALIGCRRRWRRLRWVIISAIVWSAVVYAARSAYYMHTSLWQLAVLLAVPFGYAIVDYTRRRHRSEEARLRLMVITDWPRLDELMQPWPYEDVDVADIAGAETDLGWRWGQREFSGEPARRLKAFLDAQETSAFYYRGSAYRIWYEWLDADMTNGAEDLISTER